MSENISSDGVMCGTVCFQQIGSEQPTPYLWYHIPDIPHKPLLNFAPRLYLPPNKLPLPPATWETPYDTMYNNLFPKVPADRGGETIRHVLHIH